MPCTGANTIATVPSHNLNNRFYQSHPASFASVKWPASKSTMLTHAHFWFFFSSFFSVPWMHKSVCRMASVETSIYFHRNAISKWACWACWRTGIMYAQNAVFQIVKNLWLMLIITANMNDLFKCKICKFIQTRRNTSIQTRVCAEKNIWDEMRQHKNHTLVFCGRDQTANQIKWCTDLNTFLDLNTIYFRCYHRRRRCSLNWKC